MLPQAYELPGAIALIVGGLVACFAGQRLFRVVLALYGFIFGAMIASSVMGMSNTAGMLVAALVGGLAGSLVMLVAWFVGVAIIGAGLAALVAHLIWAQVGTGDPPAIGIIVVSVAGALGAMVLQRYVIVVGTALGGAWTAIAGGLHVLSARAGAAAKPAVDDVWIFYPVPASAPAWLPMAWIALGLLGVIVQLKLTSGRPR